MFVKIAAASLNQTPLDWEGNFERIARAVKEAKRAEVALLCLPELCITGYGCEDVFLSAHLQQSALNMLERIRPHCSGIAVSLGLPVCFEGALYDCTCLVVDTKVLGFAAKRFLAGDGIHYEPRWFKAWPRGRQGEVLFGEQRLPIGDLLFDLQGVRVGFEICEDAWAAMRPGAVLAEQAVDVILNPSASHFAFGKLETRKRFVVEGSRAFTAAYVYANLSGNEAGRIIYDGGALIASGGKLVAQGPRFSFQDVVLTSATVDLQENRLLRARRSPGTEPSEEALDAARLYRVVESSYRLATRAPHKQQDFVLPLWEQSPSLKEQEFARAVALGLFDYLRKSSSRGFVISLSGGADSSAVACLCALCFMLAVKELGFEETKRQLCFIPGIDEAQTQAELHRLLITCIYQATSNSSARTQSAATNLANALHADFYEVNIDPIVAGYRALGELAIGEELSWERHDTSLQNIQARSRAPMAWLLANLKGALLLATSNRSEAAVGYTTMDGDTAGGLSPIGGIDKAFLLRWLQWLESGGVEELGELPALNSVTSQAPTAELRPPEAGQTDEADLMPYPVLDMIERFAVRDKKSPLEIYQLLINELPEHSNKEIVKWIERFFRLWSRNQWKRERYAPSFHLDDENLDPKTWCRFPILSGGYESELAELRKVVN